MPLCAAPGCNNRTDRGRSDRNNPSDASFHRFPIDNPELLKKWLHVMRRKDYKPSKYSRLCSAHFSPDSFEEDKYAKYGIRPQNVKKGRMLKDNAVPTVFAHQEPEVKRPSSVARRERQERREHMLELLASPTLQEKELHYAEKSTGRKLKTVKRKQSKITSKTTAETESESNITPAGTVEPGMLAGQFRQHGQPENIFSTQGVQIPPVWKKHKAAETMSRAEAEMEETAIVQHELHMHVDPFMEPVQPSFHLGRQPTIPALYGTPHRTRLDHAYATGNTRTFGTQTDVQPEVTSKTFETTTEVEGSSPITSPMKSEFGDMLVSDIEFLPPTDISDTSETSDSDSRPPVDPCDEQKFNVFADKLNELHRFCKDCGNAVISRSSFTKGSMIGYKISCHKGHTYVWHSQSMSRKQPVGNLLIASAILTSGNTYAKVKSFADLLNLCLISKSVFNKLQRHTILPVIQDLWGKERAEAVAEVKSMGPVVLSGDGRCDSPGHTAKYGSYTLMHCDGDGKTGTRKIVSMKLVQVSEVKNSNHMEPEGLQRCLKEVLSDGVYIDVLATDQHLMINSLMKTNFKEINHQFDTWHLAKSITKKLTAKASQKDCSDLSKWIQSISNHLWWASATCGGSQVVLREKWMSLLHHSRNKHHWSGNSVFHKCSHKTITPDQKTVKWLKPDSPAFGALKSIVSNPRFLKSLNQLTKFCHTGDLEVFHSMLLKYCPKRQHFHYDAMTGRLMLAAMDWNSSCRKPKFDKSGNPATSVVYSKRRKCYVLKNRYEKVGSAHMFSIIKRTYEVHRDNLCLPPMDRPAELPQNVAKIPKPTREELEEQFRSRFAKN